MTTVYCLLTRNWTIVWFCACIISDPFVVPSYHAFLYLHWCSTRFPYEMMFVPFNSITTGVTSGTGTANPSEVPVLTPRFFSKVRVTWSLVLWVVFCRSLFVLLSIFLSPLGSMSFFDYGFWLALWYLQTFLSLYISNSRLKYYIWYIDITTHQGCDKESKWCVVHLLYK